MLEDYVSENTANSAGFNYGREADHLLHKDGRYCRVYVAQIPGTDAGIAAIEAEKKDDKRRMEWYFSVFYFPGRELQDIVDSTMKRKFRIAGKKLEAAILGAIPNKDALRK